MAPLPTPRRELTEIALKLLAWAERDLAHTSGPIISGNPRVVRGLLGTGDPETIRRHAAILRMVSIVEAYLDALSKDLMNGYITQRFPALEHLVEDFEGTYTTTWDKRKESYAKFHRINFGECPDWSKFDAAKEARNSVAHGLGRITNQQKKRRRIVEEKLALLEIWLIDDHLRTGDNSLGIVQAVCTALVKFVDERASQP